MPNVVLSSQPTPGSSRGYRHGAIFETFILTSREGAKCLEDVIHHL